MQLFVYYFQCEATLESISEHPYAAEMMHCDIVGPICESGDVLGMLRIDEPYFM